MGFKEFSESEEGKRLSKSLTETCDDLSIMKGNNPYGVTFEGFCPVQATGILPEGEYYYFRSRWETTRLDVASCEEDWKNNNLLFSKEVIPESDASWLPYEEALTIFNKLVEEYLKDKRDATIKETKA